MVRRYEVRPHTSTQFRIDYARELNSAQLEAVEHFQGPCLCIAGAGTGKTRTLVYRVSRMIESGVAPESILLLTFTRKAAHEMLSRASDLGGASAMRVAGGTFHSFASRTLREFAGNLGYRPDFSILDEGDSCDILGLIRAELGLNRKEVRFPRKETLRQILSKSVNCGLSIETLVERDYDHFAEHLTEMLKVFVQYDNYKKNHQMMDYDDLLIEMQTLLEQYRPVREQLAERLRYVMVDEYQDTNRLQARITFLLGCAHRNVLVVGDDAQSIYSFRGADYRNIHEFPTLFEGCRLVRLEENYRSTNHILDASNALME
ncbi:MAG TPA: ATP-dependent helicase, partial [Candidatus Ozemobacteraceae bacterium]|nr:ATP-dependent helicase [Candidatus Ozemobacteraceae bacterium]